MILAYKWSYYGGDVGIGTTSPSAKLEVNGTSEFNNDITVTGDINGTGSFNYTSDQMFKTEIDSISNALSIIQQLKPKTYYFDTLNFSEFNFSDKKRYGFIAQDLEQVLPELVKSVVKHADYDTLGNIVHPETTFKTVNYIELIGILTKGIQEQQRKIDSLEEKTSNQDAINNSLQNQLTTTNTVFQNQLNELQAAITNCCNRPMESSTNNNNQTKSIEVESETSKIDIELKESGIQAIILEQNVPNPFAEKTTINYSLPENTVKAQMLFYNSQGKLIQTVDLNQNGKGQLNVFASDLSSGVYTYTLVVDGKIAETKRMVKQ